MEFGVCCVKLGKKWINWPTCRWGKVAWHDCIPAKQNKDGFPAWKCKTTGKFMSGMISLGLFCWEERIDMGSTDFPAYCECCGDQYICLPHVLLGLLELQTPAGVTNPKWNNLCHLWLLCVGGETVHIGGFLQSETEPKTRTHENTAEKDALMWNKWRHEQSGWFFIYMRICICPGKSEGIDLEV